MYKMAGYDQAEAYDAAEQGVIVGHVKKNNMPR